MDMDKVVQAFAVQIFTGVLDVVQQVSPLKVDQVAAHEARTRVVIEDVGHWMAGLSPDAIGFLGHPENEYLPFSDWMPLSDLEIYDETAVCAMVQRCIKSIPAEETMDGKPLVTFDVVHGAGEYLADMTDHKTGWLTERAANLLALSL